MNTADWIILIVLSLATVAVGLVYTKSSAKKGQEGFFTATGSLMVVTGPSNASTISQASALCNAHSCTVSLQLAWWLSGSYGSSRGHYLVKMWQRIEKVTTLN